jgi:hypothetical protein
MKLPQRHVSIRVSWHDRGWDGTMCANAKGNASCLVLREVRENRDDEAEQLDGGKSILELQEQKRPMPACLGERGTFMSPFPFDRIVAHPYASFSPAHKHIKPATFRHPAYSAATIPFRWMMRDTAFELGQEFDLDVDEHREPEDGWLASNTWVQNYDNQRALLDAFFSAVEPEKSLCFFYAKQTPLSDSEDRVLVGVGRVLELGPLVDYVAQPGELNSYVWDRAVVHSIRPQGAEGFLLPYAEILARAAEDESLDPSEFVAVAPDDRRAEFSYAGEHVTHDGAIAALLSCKSVLERWAPHSATSVEPALQWIDARLGELWTLRGPTPGLGAVLAAHGFEHANFLAAEVVNQLNENESPWPLLDSLLADPTPLPFELVKRLTPMKRNVWANIKETKPERRALLELLARFELTAEQATRFWLPESREDASIDCADGDLLANPYLLYELDRRSPDSISLLTVDRGVFPVPAIRSAHPLPPPSAVDDALDARRLRSLTVGVLEEAAEDGHTLRSRGDVVRAIREQPLDPPSLVDQDTFDVAEESFGPTVEKVEMADGSPAYQLERLNNTARIIRNAVTKRVAAVRHGLDVDWRSELDARLKDPRSGDEEREEIARSEKAAALAELAAARFAVLIGPAGTGKTTLLQTLGNHPSVKAAGVLLLAPTGKARVRLQTTTGLDAQTVAQFLAGRGRYDGETGAYLVTGENQFDGAKTVIVDEASMLTEEMLASLIDSLKGVDRLILVGDPRQLPPIGAGRPFVDIVAHLAPENVESMPPPRVAPGYVELTVKRRHAAEGVLDTDRDDVQLADWFSGAPVAPGEDDVFTRALENGGSQSLRFVRWNEAADLREVLLDVIADELNLEGRDDVDGFAETLGGTEHEGRIYFHRGRGPAEAAEAWQILSPVGGLPHGVRDINRLVQLTFRSGDIERARDPRNKKIPKPLGPENIVYGDKVINIRNGWKRGRNVYPQEGALKYVANGEIGIAVGTFARQGWTRRPNTLEVEFSSQGDFAYKFFGGELQAEGTPRLQLAYAVTVHKAQGSEFGTCFLVLPKESRILSRELIYTALTRQKKRIVILHQGDRADLKRFASDYFSETKRRLTNLFAPPSPVQIRDRFFEKNLIHRSRRGELMRSKSEVIIANELDTAGVPYEYDTPLVLSGEMRSPDFTIEDADTGRTHYWEHCGMLTDAGYARRWAAKQHWYRENGVLPEEEGGGPKGTLVVTEDDEKGGIDSAAVHQKIQELFG